MIRRREFIAGLGAAAAWPFAVRAQRPMPVIGYLRATAPTTAPILEAFRAGLAEAGYNEGQNVEIRYCWANNRADRLAQCAAELAHSQVAVIAALDSGPTVRAAKARYLENSNRVPLRR
jgi:putative ABC transport system substrate-binding protein